MNKRLLWVAVLLAAALMLMWGCSQRPPVEEAEPPVIEEPEEPPPPPPPPPVEEEPPPPPVEIVLETVYFDFDKYNLKSDAKARLAVNARVLESNPEVTILIEGHCDERGTEEYNLALGERRAKSARDYLIDLGVAASRIRTISYGEERPADPGHNEAAWDKNRRADFVRTDQ
jgi:peptidoglycan-associated lipoprotein